MEYKTLGDRMKGAYENKYRYYLPDNIPIIIRLDGSHFHSFCRGMKKPFDPIFIKAMQNTMLSLCENIANVKFGYVESDEISLLMMTTKKNTQPWFDNNIQKIVSTSAALCSVYFNEIFAGICLDELNLFAEVDTYDYKMLRKGNLKPTFDSRVFVLPEFEVQNYYIWRQQDCSRNSILSLAQSLYSAKEIENFKTPELVKKMQEEKNVDWNSYTSVEKYGTCAYKIPTTAIGKDGKETIRNKWTLDINMPILTSEEGEDFILQKALTNDFIQKPRES